MDIWFKHFPEYGVTLNVFAGKLTREAMMEFIGQIEPVEWRCWINYLDPTLDMTGIVAEDYPVVRRAFADKLRAIYGKAHFNAALVSGSPAYEFFLDFWPRFVGGDILYPVEIVAAPTVEAACEGLRLPEGASEAIIKAISAAPENEPSPTPARGGA
jgi:hypothetical protein